MTPHPEPRIMTTAEPTFAELAEEVRELSLAVSLTARVEATIRELSTYPHFGMPTHVLASHIETLIESSDEHCHRLTALERVQRDAVVDADLALDTYTREVQDDLADVTAERDALRDLLEQYAAVDEGLGLHLPNCRKHVYDRRSSPCTCGLAAALASATPAEGGS